MKPALDHNNASMTVVEFKRGTQAPSFVFYHCGHDTGWRWKDSMTGKSSVENFTTQSQAMNDAMNALGRN